jgi:hypothetical protein
VVGVTVVVVTALRCAVVAVVAGSCDVGELIGALVVGTVGSSVTTGGGGSVGAPIAVVRVAPGLVGAVDTVEGGTEVVDVTRSVVVVSSACSAATVTSGCGVFGSAVTEVAPEGRRSPPAVGPTEPTWAWTATAPTSRHAPNAQTSQPERGPRRARPRSSALGGPQGAGNILFYRLLPTRAVALASNGLVKSGCARFGDHLHGAHRCTRSISETQPSWSPAEAYRARVSRSSSDAA